LPLHLWKLPACNKCKGITLEEWESTYESTIARMEDGYEREQAIKSFIKDEICKAEENAKTNILRELKQMADKEVKISMVAGEIIQVRQLEVIQTVAKLHNIRL